MQELIENKHPRFKKEFAVSRRQPFGTATDYIKCVENGSSDRVVKLIKVVGMLMQTEAYLFSEKGERRRPAYEDF
jgi:hypothetical protein